MIVQKLLIVCKKCGSTFTSKKTCKSRTPKYCSKQCYAQSIIKERPCPVCLKIFPSYPKTKFCSVKCREIGKATTKGRKFSDEHRMALSEGRKKSIKCRGHNLYNWRGGLSTLNRRMNISAHKRRSAQKIEIDPIFLENLFKAQSGRCFYCDSKLYSYKAIEHLTPLSRGGDNEKYNMVYACKSCNSKKRTKTLEEFAIKQNRFDWLDKFDLIFPTAVYGV